MSITYTCNLCGETIARDSPLVVLNGDGERSARNWRTGWVGHYHADPDVGCWQRILDVIRAADGWASRLEGIPTAPDDSIADARAKHRREDFRVVDDTAPPTDDELPPPDGERTADGEP